MQTLTALMKLAAVAIASLFVGSPMAPVADPVTDLAEPQTSTEGTGGSGGSGGSGSNAQPANKIAAAGSSIKCMSDVPTTDCPTNTVTLFDTWIKASNPEDLIIQVNAECALWTLVEVVDDDDSETPEEDVPVSEAAANMTVWVTIDGVIVPVDSGDVGLGKGKVVFCHRLNRMTLTENVWTNADGDQETDPDNETISNYLETRQASSFSWLALNLGSYPGIGLDHHIKVFAELASATDDTSDAVAQAGVGKRTLIAEPIKMANNAAI
jgi:hypothetical protein